MDTLKKAAILTIGDELMIGQIVDSNSAWISVFLDRLGWKIEVKMTVGDNIDEIIGGIEFCKSKASLLILTGGLGPTNDDRTVDALCQYFKTPKIWHEETWQRLIAIMHRFGREANETHKHQCFVPEAAVIIENDRGTAPGLFFLENDLILASVPGVPEEMRHLLGEKIIHELPKGNPVEHRFIRTAGEGETFLAERIADLEDSLPPTIKLAYLPSYGHVTLRLTSHDPMMRERIDFYQQQIADRLRPFVYSTGDGSMARTIGEMLRERKETIATGESCTGGYLAHMITSVPGSSDYYMGSVIPYSYELKTELLGIPAELLNTYGAVSEEVIRLMASGTREKLGVTWALATSGIAGPGGATPHKPVGTIWIACAGPDGIKTRLLHLNRDRIGNIQYTANVCLILLRKMILENAGS